MQAYTCMLSYNKIQPMKLINIEFKPEMNKTFKLTFHNADNQTSAGLDAACIL